MKRFVVFNAYNNLHIKDALVERCIKLGYKSLSPTIDSVSLDTFSGQILNTIGHTESNFYQKYSDHEKGDFDKLFNTNEYRFAPPLRIADYEVKFLESGINVGCRFVKKEDIKTIAEKFFTVIEKEE